MRRSRRNALKAGATLALGASIPGARLLAQQRPVKIGMGIAQTGPLAASGKAALVALRMWVEDVNARGGLLGRRVELIAYDDQGSASATPVLYAKLLDVDRVDLLIAPYGTVPTAPLMGMVKSRGKLLMGNFSFQVNHVVKHDMSFNNAPWNDASSFSPWLLPHRTGARRKQRRVPGCRQRVRAEPGERSPRVREAVRAEDPLRPELSARHHRIFLDDSLHPAPCGPTWCS